MQKNLTNKKLKIIIISILSVILFIFIAQYIAIAILKSQNNNLQNQLQIIKEDNIEIENNIKKLSDKDELIEYARQNYGYTYPDEEKFIGN